MYDATIRGFQNVHIEMDKLIDNMWLTMNMVDDQEYFVKIWNVLFENYGVSLDENHLIGWEKEDYVPYLRTDLVSDFQFTSQEDFYNQCSLTVVTDLLNVQISEKEWKTKVRNYLVWLGYWNKN